MRRVHKNVTIEAEQRTTRWLTLTTHISERDLARLLVKKWHSLDRDPERTFLKKVGVLRRIPGFPPKLVTRRGCPSFRAIPVHHLPARAFVGFEMARPSTGVLPWAQPQGAGSPSSAPPTPFTASDVLSARWDEPTVNSKVQVLWFVYNDGDDEASPENEDEEEDNDDDPGRPTWFSGSVSCSEIADDQTERAHKAVEKVLGTQPTENIAVRMLQYDAQPEDDFAAESRLVAFVKFTNSLCGAPYHVLVDVAWAEECPTEQSEVKRDAWLQRIRTDSAQTAPIDVGDPALQKVLDSDPRHEATLRMATYAVANAEADIDNAPAGTFPWMYTTHEASFGGWNGGDTWFFEETSAAPLEELVNTMQSKFGANATGRAMTELKSVIQLALQNAVANNDKDGNATLVSVENVNVALETLRKRKRDE